VSLSFGVRFCQKRFFSVSYRRSELMIAIYTETYKPTDPCIARYHFSPLWIVNIVPANILPKACHKAFTLSKISCGFPSRFSVRTDMV